MTALHVFTPCIRPENLPAIYKALDLERKTTSMEVDWTIVLDCGFEGCDETARADAMNQYRWSHQDDLRFPKASWVKIENAWLTPRPDPCYGELILNEFVFGGRGPKTGWIRGQADDNLPVEGEFRAIEGSIAAGAEVAVVFPQGPRYGFPQGIPANYRQLKPGAIDGGQLVFNIEAANGLIWPRGGCPDGQFAQNLWRMHPLRGWVFLREPVVAYNALRPEPR